MARHAGLLPGLLAVALLFASVHVFLGFVAPQPPTSAPSRRPGRGDIALRARGGARGGGPDIDGWIGEVTGGSGGLPDGAMKEYIMKWFWPAKDDFTGPGKTPGKKDHKKVFEILKDAFKKDP